MLLKIANTKANTNAEGMMVMKHTDVSNRLIEQAIHIVAQQGLDKTTTKSIVKGTDIHEAYIYRYFTDKYELLIKTFEKLDDELVAKVTQHMHVMHDNSLDYETRCRIFFLNVWNFMLTNSERCLTYIRYYYSPYFKRYSAEEHERRFIPLLNVFCKAFKAEANVWMLMNHILNVMLDFAVKVFDGTVGNDDDTAEHVFRLIYFSVSPYFKKYEELLAV